MPLPEWMTNRVPLAERPTEDLIASLAHDERIATNPALADLDLLRQFHRGAARHLVEELDRRLFD